MDIINNSSENEILVSVIMAAYNSESTIELSLKNIREQTLKQVEILVVDGGSTDNTISIAKKYGAIVLHNERRLPEIAKVIGLKKASGKYILIMDSDEVMCSNDILMKRVTALETIPGLKSIQGAIQIPKDMHVESCSSYINEVGDPFTCFVYKTYKGQSMPRLIIEKAQYYENLECYVGHFSRNDIRPIGDSLTVMNREYIMSHYSDMIENGCTTAAIYDRTVADTGITAHIKGDRNYHYSSASFKTYFKKLKFRVINNIFDVKGSGYSAAAEINPTLNKRKYLFPFYTASIVIPIYHGICMSFRYKHPVFLLHPVFAIYVMFEIVYQYFCKFIGKSNTNKSYAK